MTMYIGELRRLQAAGGPLLRRYRDLLARRDASAHDSPAARELGDFLRAWRTDPEALRLQCQIAEDGAAPAARKGES
jgi:hypothetical protein